MKQILIFLFFISFVSNIKSLNFGLKYPYMGAYPKCVCPSGTYRSENGCIKHKTCQEGYVNIGNICIKKKNLVFQDIIYLMAIAEEDFKFQNQ